MKNASVALAAASMVMAPVAASAAPQYDGIRAGTQVVDAQAMGEGRGEGNGGGWLLAILAAAAIIAGIIIAVDGRDTTPTSP